MHGRRRALCPWSRSGGLGCALVAVSHSTKHRSGATYANAPPNTPTPGSAGSPSRSCAMSQPAQPTTAFTGERSGRDIGERVGRGRRDAAAAAQAHLHERQLAAAFQRGATPINGIPRHISVRTGNNATSSGEVRGERYVPATTDKPKVSPTTHIVSARPNLLAL